MTDAPERIKLELRQSFSADFWSELRDPRYAKSPPVEYIRADKVAALASALRWYHDQQCEGFCKDLRFDSDYTPDMDDECAGCKARAALASLDAKP